VAGTPTKKQRGVAAKTGPDESGTGFCGQAPKLIRVPAPLNSGVDFAAVYGILILAKR
jgi:hypothetical protein